MGTLLDHAKRELGILGMTEDSLEASNVAMRKHILHMVNEFSKERHSNFSAHYAVKCLQRLLEFEPLTPLTGEDSEWYHVTSEKENNVEIPVYQNIRCSRVFKQANRFEGQAYDVEGRKFVDSNGHIWLTVDSIIPITFPYTPSTEYVRKEDV